MARGRGQSPGVLHSIHLSSEDWPIIRLRCYLFSKNVDIHINIFPDIPNLSSLLKLNIDLEWRITCF